MVNAKIKTTLDRIDQKAIITGHLGILDEKQGAVRLQFNLSRDGMTRSVRNLAFDYRW